MDVSRGFETWWPGRGLHENLKPAFFMVWKAALDSVEDAQLAAPASDRLGAGMEHAAAICDALAKDQPQYKGPLLGAAAVIRNRIAAPAAQGERQPVAYRSEDGRSLLFAKDLSGPYAVLAKGMTPLYE